MFNKKKNNINNVSYDETYEKVFNYFFWGIAIATVATLFIGGITHYLSWTVAFKICFTGFVTAGIMVLASHKPTFKKRIRFHS